MARPLHEHPLYRISAVARPIDPRWASNRAILVIQGLAFVGGAVWGFVQTGAWTQALVSGLVAAFTAFLSWALGRELDPDRNATAFVATALALAAFFVFDDLDLWALAAALVLGRLVARTVGPPAKMTDLVIVVVLVTVAAVVTERWTLAVITAVALVLDAVLPGGSKTRLGFAALAAAPALWLWTQRDVQVAMPVHPWALGVLVLVTVAAIVTLPPLRSPCDLPGHELRRLRVQAGIFVALLLVLLASLEGNAYPAPALAACLLATVAGRGFRPDPGPPPSSAGS